MCCNLSMKRKIISTTSNRLNRLHLRNMILCQKIFVCLDLMSALFSVSNSIKKEAEAMLSSNKFVWFISYWISRQTAPRWRNIHHTTAHIFSTNCQIFTPTILFLPRTCFLFQELYDCHIFDVFRVFCQGFLRAAFKRPLNMLRIQAKVFCNGEEPCSDALKVWTVKGWEVWTMWWVWSFY